MDMPLRWMLVAAALVLLLLVAPNILARRASRALRWGRLRAARVYALLAALARPSAAQRMFLRSVGLSARMDQVAPNVDELCADLGLGDDDLAVQRLALLSWTDDFEAMAAALEHPACRALALAGPMAGTLVLVRGELGGVDDVVWAYHWLGTVPALARPTAGATWALLLTAAYLGEAELVVTHAADLDDEVPPDRLAFARATALQRQGRVHEAQAVIAEAARKAPTRSGQRRLMHRRDHPLEPEVPGRHVEVVQQIRATLQLWRALGRYRRAMRRAEPLVTAVSLSLVAAFAWQQGSSDSVPRFGVWSAWEAAPDWWRLASYGWLHVGPAHLVINLLGLTVFGRVVEAVYGTGRFLLVYLAGVLAGGAAFLAWQAEGGIAVGASGAVMALFGATAAHAFSEPVLRRTRAGRTQLAGIGIVALAQVLSDLLVQQSAGSAHAGGMVAGVVLGLALRPRSGRGVSPSGTPSSGSP